MSTALDCPGVECWKALFSDTVPPDQSEQFERHLESCAFCQERLRRTNGDGDELRQLGQEFGDPTAAPGDPTLGQFLERLRAAKGKSRPVPSEPADLYFLQPSDQPDLLGTLGEYEIRKVIGQGGMGVVLKAFEPRLQRLVAIKVLAPALAGSRVARCRFTREAQAAAAVCHDHVVAVHGVRETDGLPYLVMQFVPGESLQERLDRVGPLAVEEVVHIGIQTAAGLAAAHAQGLIHRDIKPANLLLEGEPGMCEPPGLSRRSATTGVRVKITDFGLARTIDNVGLTQAGVVAGTPEYMAPEQARGEPVDPRADLFSLGCVLYACCTGLPPFRGESVLSVLRQVTEQAPVPIQELNPDVPAWLDALIARLLAKEPANRCRSAAEVAELLESYLAHLRQPATVPPPELSPTEQTRRQEDKETGRRRTRLSLLVCLLTALGLLAFGLALFMFGQLVLPQDAAKGPKLKETPAEPCDVWSVAISPDGKVAAAGAGWWTSPGEIGVWDIATLKPLQRFAEDRGVGSVVFSSNGKLLASGSWSSHVRVHDWAAGKEIADFTVLGIARVAFSPDNTLLATASEGQTLQLWNVAQGELLADLQGDLVRFQCVGFSPNGQRVLAGGGDWKKGGVNHVAVWDVASKKQVLKLSGHENSVMCLACSPDGTTIATGSLDTTIRLWDAGSGQPLKTLRGPTNAVECLAFSADGRTLISCGRDPIIRFWNLEQGKETSQLDTRMPSVRTLHLSPDGKTLIAGGAQKTLKIFNVENRQEVAVLWNGADPRKLAIDELPVSAQQNTGVAASFGRAKFLAVAFAVALIVFSITWLLVRHGRGADKSPAQPPVADPPAEREPVVAKIAFGCSACGTKLKARTALAGKKVKCSQCGQPVVVPSIQAGKSE